MSYTWDLLDSDLLQRLSARKFVSLTLDRQLRVPASAEELSGFLKSATQTNKHLLKPLEIGNVKYRRVIDYLSDDEDNKAESPEGVFASSMPGAMSIEELETEVDLGAWLIKIGDEIVMLEV